MTPDLHQAADVVRLAHDRGVILWPEGDRLRFRSIRPLSSDLVDLLTRWKQPLLSYLEDPTLEALCAGLPPEDAQDLQEERAAILEYEAGLSRDEAECRAGIAHRRAVA